MNIRFAVAIFLSMINLQLYSQQKNLDTKDTSLILKPYKRNVIKLNPTLMILFKDVRNLTLSYERLIKDYQSLAVQAGYITFPAVFKDTVAGLINFTDDYRQQGVSLAFDYRCYPSLRNRRPAPDGLYVGGFVSYHHFSYDNDFDILRSETTEDGGINGKINILNLGIDLGYQLVFWKKLTVDLIVFGPSLNYTFGKGEINGNLDAGEISEIEQALLDILDEEFPVLTTVLSDESLSFDSNRGKFDLGFRYAIMVGFHL